MSQNIYQLASRQQLRFETVQGTLSVEQLWKLPLQTTRPEQKASLYSIATDLHKKVNSTSDVPDFLQETPSQESKIYNLQFDIVKDIIQTIQAENKIEANRRQINEENQQLMAAIKAKKGEALTTGTVEELEAKLALRQAQATTV